MGIYFSLKVESFTRRTHRRENGKIHHVDGYIVEQFIIIMVRTNDNPETL
jgi:hypothetical protein